MSAATIGFGQEAPQSFAQSIRDGSFDLAFRYRYEYVDQAGFSAEANASTLRTRVTYRSASYADFSAFFELDDLRPIGADGYNSTRNGKAGRPTVADPKGTDLNQAGIRYTGLADTIIVAGRQRLNHANQRFIGSVGWRQNEQTMDAVEVGHSFTDTFSGRYTYVSNVNRVFGPDSGSPTEEFGGSSHFLDARYELADNVGLTGYGYFLDFDNAAGASNRTLGLRLAGTADLNERLTMPYVVEYARQDDYANNPNSFDADYYLLEAGLSASGHGFKLGYEVLSGNGTPGQAFTTPLATLHAFQGWADMFLGTPADGIEDFYAAFNGRFRAVNFSVVAHDFSADNGGASYGSELDLSAGWTFADNYSILLKLASYDADTHAVDTDKLWVMLSTSF